MRGGAGLPKRRPSFSLAGRYSGLGTFSIRAQPHLLAVARRDSVTGPTNRALRRPRLTHNGTRIAENPDSNPRDLGTSDGRLLPAAERNLN